MKKYLRSIFVIIYTLSLFVVMSLEIQNLIHKSGVSLINILYWYFFIGSIYYIYNYKKKSGFSFRCTLIIFFIGELFVVLRFESVGEYILKTGYLFLVIGMVQTLIEYKKKKNNFKRRP